MGPAQPVRLIHLDGVNNVPPVYAGLRYSSKNGKPRREASGLLLSWIRYSTPLDIQPYRRPRPSISSKLYLAVITAQKQIHLCIGVPNNR